MKDYERKRGKHAKCIRHRASARRRVRLFFLPLLSGYVFLFFGHRVQWNLSEYVKTVGMDNTERSERKNSDYEL